MHVARAWPAHPAWHTPAPLPCTLLLLSCIVSELAASDACEDGGALRRIMQLGKSKESCHLCGRGHDSQSHFRYQYPAAGDALVQVPLEISSVLATSSYIM